MSTVTLTATIGSTAERAVLRVTSPSVKDDAGNVIYAGGLRVVRFVDGRLSIDLLATDTPGTNPLPGTWTYGFEVRWRGGYLPKFYAELTADMDLADLQVMDETDPVYLPVSMPTSRVEGLDAELDTKATVTSLSSISTALSGAIDTEEDARIAADAAQQTALAPQVTQFITAQDDTPYAIPVGAKVLKVRAQGSGGGGGSGRRGAAGTIRCGGGGGGGGGLSEWEIAVTDLAVSTLYVNVGAGGTGGAAQTVDDTNGVNGYTGGASSVNTTGTPGFANTIAHANGGGAGSGGTTNSGLAGAGALGRINGSNGGAGSTTGLIGGNGTGSVSPGAGAGGGLTAANVASNGGNGGYTSGRYMSASNGTAGVAPGGNGTLVADSPVLSSGYGGGGGASHSSGAGGSGASPVNGAGGGGGASVNGNDSGPGGNGGDGFVEIVAYF